VMVLHGSSFRAILAWRGACTAGFVATIAQLAYAPVTRD
jgi:hypothetical protein